MYEFFVVMQKRRDGKVYADLHKTTEKMYLMRLEANQALKDMGDLTPYFHVVRLFAVTVVDNVYQIDKDEI